MSLLSKVVIVTGGSSGIGAATAELFAKERAKVVIVGRNLEKLNNVSKKITSESGLKPLVVVADISKDLEAKSVIEKTISHYGKIDVLVNNAGIAKFKSILSDDYITQFDEIHATNLRGTVLMTHAAVPHLIKTKGNIVNVSSIAATLSGSGGVSSYCTSKAGLDHFTRCIAAELAPKGIRVNIVNPGPVKTDISLAAGYTKEESDKMYELTATKTPLKVVTESEEVGHVIVFLSSDKGRCITGSNYFIDCGVQLVGLQALV